MENTAKSIESLIEKTTDYGKITIELIKLKTLDKISDVVSSLIPNSVVFLLVATFLVFFNLGLAFWLGQILSATFLGFFIVAAFYGIMGVILYFFMHNWLKKRIYDYIIKLVLK